MINEFFKSTVRTLGRIFAYALIGFIIFYILSIFKVQAQTIYANNYYFQTFNRSGVMQEDDIGTQISDYNHAVEFNVIPVANGQDQNITPSDYYINFRFQIALNTNLNITTGNIKPNLSIHFNNVNATCDGNVYYQLSEKVIQYNQLYLTYDYTCTLLTVTQNFSTIRINLLSPSFLDQMGIYPVQLFINQLEFLDSNDLNTDTGAIVDRIDDQTSIIINNNNENTQNIINSQNNTTIAVNDINSTINNSNVDNPNNAINGLNSNLPSTNGIQSIFLLPVTLIQVILNSLNNTSCSTISLGTLYGTTLSLPCINLQSILGNSVYSIIDLICCFGIIFGLRKYILEIFHKISSLKEDNLND